MSLPIPFSYFSVNTETGGTNTDGAGRDFLFILSADHVVAARAPIERLREHLQIAHDRTACAVRLRAVQDLPPSFPSPDPSEAYVTSISIYIVTMLYMFAAQPPRRSVSKLYIPRAASRRARDLRQGRAGSIQMEETSAFGGLCDDAVMDILVRLPSESVLRCRAAQYWFYG